MRNCLFSGPATNWLRRAARSEVFIKATGGSLNEKTMRDREAINRFCAFRLLGVERYKSDMDDFLAKSLEKMNELDEDDRRKLARAFNHTMSANFYLFGIHAFRKSLAAGDQSAKRSVINMALFDVCSVLFADSDDAFIKKKASRIRQTLTRLLKENNQFIKSITYATNDLKQVTYRFAAMDKAIKEVG